MTDENMRHGVSGVGGYSQWRVVPENLDGIARWTGGQVDLAEPKQGVFVPTLEGPVLAPLGSWVIRMSNTGRFTVEEDARTVEQLQANIQATEDLLTSQPAFESEDDLQAVNQRKPMETHGVPIDVRAMRLKSVSLDNDGMGYIRSVDAD